MADDRPVPLDDYPVHQVPLSMKHVATGDRNAYDRSIFHVLDHEGRALLVAGLGVYPNTGVIDAYATLRIGDTLHAVRASDALGDDRMRLAVGPLRTHVAHPLREYVLSCAADPAKPNGLSYEIHWCADFAALWEPLHQQRSTTWPASTAPCAWWPSTRTCRCRGCSGWRRTPARWARPSS